MPKLAVSRRDLLAAGACALSGTAALSARAHAMTTTNEQIVRNYYAAWEQKDWHPFDLLLAGNFTFTSANNDDHISKAAFKERCWHSQIDFIDRFQLDRVIGNEDDVFVKYTCHTKNGKAFRNVELFRLANNKIASIECYFGEQSSFPSAVSAGHN